MEETSIISTYLHDFFPSSSSYLTLSNKVDKCMHSVCLSVRTSVYPHSNSHKYSSNVMKLIYVIHIWHSMNRIENCIDMTDIDGLSREIHKSFSIHYNLQGKYLKRILTYLDCTKYNEINISPSHIQKHVAKKMM